MDPLLNPFSPGAGTPPPALAGRSELLEQALLTLARVKQGRSVKSMLLVGLRGTGKTVLLYEISKLAENADYQAVMIEAHENKSLPEILLPELRRILFTLDTGEFISAKVKKAFRVLKSFVSNVKFSMKLSDINFGIDIEPERGTADSGDLEMDLTQLFIALGEAAQDRKTAIALIIDELQYLNEDELSSLIMATHKISQKSLPLVLMGAGLPQLIGNVGKAKSYAERLFDFPEIGALSVEDAKFALQEPVRKEHAKFTKEALDEIIKVTQGYPYFLQEWGYQAWNIATRSSFDIEVAKKSTLASIKQLDKNFFRVRFDRLTPREQDYLRALAELGPGPQKSGDISNLIKMQVQNAAPLRNNLIKKGMIYSPQHGYTAFTVPLFDTFMKRIIPKF